MIAASKQVKVLDHGYIQLVESWGDDQRIVEAARMSVDRGFEGWGPHYQCKACGCKWRNNQDGSVSLFNQEQTACAICDNGPITDSTCGTFAGDEGLLRRLYTNKHATPFEMGGLLIEVQAPIFVFREWHRHRTQCLHPDTLVWFERPSDGRPYPMRIEDVWRKWQPTQRSSRPERQTNSLGLRERLQQMKLRCLNEETREFTTTQIVDVIKGEPKPMVTVTTDRFSLTATLAHRVFTPSGWMTLGEAIEQNARLAQCGTERGLPEPKPVAHYGDEKWRFVVGWEDYYQISSHGNVRRIGGRNKKLTQAATGYYVCSLSRPGEQKLASVHRLVAESFVPNNAPARTEVCHSDHNKLNNNAQNLRWGTPAENTGDTLKDDRFQRLSCVFEEITSVTDTGESETFDLAVSAPWHNFVAEGIVVHNSYNEASARYAPLPALDYVPTVERLMINADKTNKQAGTVKGADQLTPLKANAFTSRLRWVQTNAQQCYEEALSMGVPKELARGVLTVNRYSKMRAQANLRNWIGFLILRTASDAQWETRQYANEVSNMVREVFPRTWELFNEEQAFSQKLTQLRRRVGSTKLLEAIEIALEQAA